MFADLVDMFREADLTMVLEHRAKLARAASRKSAEDGGAGRRPMGIVNPPPVGPSGRRGDPQGVEKILLRIASEA
jgi:hypothetical protein